MTPPPRSPRAPAPSRTIPGLQVLTGPGDFYDMWPPLARVASWLYLHGYVTVMTLALAPPPVFGSNLAMRTACPARA